MTIKKIVVIGPESTGKSTLCKQLAAHYGSLWVPEYAREYLLKNGTKYSLEDLSIIADGQIHNEETIAAAGLNRPLTTDHQLLFIDTDLYVIKVWSEFVFNACDNRILSQVATRKYDLYLLCSTDLPWEKDELREYPDLSSREKLFHYYKDALVNQYVPWALISGSQEERLQNAIRAVDMLK
jgi:NadR type nicotinamide-nucleotide adenylyltransferase